MLVSLVCFSDAGGWSGWDETVVAEQALMAPPVLPWGVGAGTGGATHRQRLLGSGFD
jgi:hypothetical protein